MRSAPYERTSAAPRKGLPAARRSLHTKKAKINLMILRVPLADTQIPMRTPPLTTRTKTPASESSRSDDSDLAYKSPVPLAHRSPAQSSDPGAMNRSMEGQLLPKEMRPSRRRRMTLCIWQAIAGGFAWRSLRLETED